MNIDDVYDLVKDNEKTLDEVLEKLEQLISIIKKDSQTDRLNLFHLGSSTPITLELPTPYI